MTLRTCAIVVVIGVGGLLGCAAKAEVTPEIAISPGLKGRLMLMDRFRHTSDGRPRLPRVTVEEVDEAEIGDAEQPVTPEPERRPSEPAKP